MPNHSIQRTGKQQWSSKNVYLSHGLYAAADFYRYAQKQRTACKPMNTRAEKIINTIIWWLNLALLHYVVHAGFDSPRNTVLKIFIFILELFIAYLVTIAMIYVTNSMKTRLIMMACIIGVLGFVLFPK